MRAIVCHDFSAPLRLEEIEAPTPGPGEIAVRVEACGVNFVDGLIVTGKYQIKPALPHTPGFEVAGVVDVLGPGAEGFAPGDRVFATSGLGGGGYAERVVVDQTQVFHLPLSMTAGQGATFVQGYCTALFALTERIRLQPGSTLLVLGASGGVGRAAVDVGKALGARVIAAASSDERLAACTDIAPDGLINYGVEDLKARARELSEGGVDVVFDPLGGNHAQVGLRSLRDDGTLLIVGFASGTIPQLPANHVLLRNRRVVGVDWGGWRTAHPAAQGDLMARLLEMADSGRLHPREPAQYAFADASRALADVNGRRVVGKVVLIP